MRTYGIKSDWSRFRADRNAITEDCIGGTGVWQVLPYGRSAEESQLRFYICSFTYWLCNGTLILALVRGISRIIKFVDKS